MSRDETNYTEIKKLLGKARALEFEIMALEDLLEEEADKVMSITSSTSGVRVTATGDVHKFDRYIMLKDKINEKIEQQIIAKEEARKIIEQLEDPVLQAVLINRYVRVLPSWDDIALAMHYSSVHVNRLHRRALRAVAEEVLKRNSCS